MENMLAAPVEEGDTPRSSTEVVSQVLSQTSANSTFLKNVGLQIISKQSATSTEKALREELEEERKGSAVLRQELESLKKQAQVTEEVLAKTNEDMANTQKELEEFKKKQEATDLILRRLLNLSQGN